VIPKIYTKNIYSNLWPPSLSSFHWPKIKPNVYTVQQRFICFILWSYDSLYM